MRTLPRGLARQLADSAVGMNGPEWDDYERVVTQAKTDKTARAARAAVIANTVALRAQTRGRSLQRSSGGGTGVTSDTGRSRSNPPDESSRSRSRSFNLPLRGWGTGERRKRWLSRDSAPDVVECETSRDGSGRLSVSSGTDTISGGGGGGGSVADNLEDGDGERTGRTRSFFGLGGKFGGRRRASSSAVTEGDGGGLQMVSEGTARKDGGGNTGKKKHTRLFGGGGDRRRALSTAGSIRSADRGAGMSRLRMFSSSSQTNIPSSDHSPPEPTAGMVPSDSAADAPSSTVMSHVERRRPDTFKRCSSFPGEEGLSSPESATGATAAAGRSRVVSAAAVSTNTRAANKYSGGQVSSLQQRRRRTLSTEAAELEEIRESTVTPTASERGSSVFYTPSTTSKVNSRWNITRRRSTGSTDGDPGVSTKKKGVLRSLQRTLGTGSGSRKSSKSVTVVIQGRAPRGQPSSGNVNAGAVGENGVTDERGSAATAESRLLAPVEPEVSQAELQRRREAEEKAVRAELLRKIVCLEMQMLVKEIVDLACVEAEKASLLRLEVKPTPTSSTDPIAHPPVSRSSPTPERPNFFGVLWGVDQWQRQRRHTAAVEDKWKASTIEESMERSRELSMPVQSRPAVARGTGPVSAWDDTPRGGGGGRGGGQGEDEAKRSDSGEQKVDDDGGFFAALRRKLFEGQDVVSTSNSSSMERKLPSPSPASFQDEESKTSLAASPVNRRGKQMTWATPESGDGGRVAVEVGAGSGAGSGPAETRFMPLRPGPKARAFGSDGVGGGSPSVGPPSARIPGGNVAGAVAMGVATNPAEKRQHRVVSAAVVPGAASGAVNRRRHNTTAGIAAPPPRPRQHSASSNYSRGHRQGLGAAAIAAGTAAAAADTGSSQSSGAAQTRQLSGGHIEGARAAYPADAGAGGDRPAAVPVSTDGFHGHSSATGFVPPRGRGRNSGGDMDGSARGVGARREVSPEVAEDMAARFGLVRMVFGDQNN